METKRICSLVKKAFLVIFLIGNGMINTSLCQAYTDDAGVIGGLDKTTPIYDYLNTYNYHLYKSDHKYSQHDMYLSSDNAVLISIWNDRLSAIYILKPGYATDKGIAVGMTINDIEYAYGKIYSGQNSYQYQEYNKAGIYHKNIGNAYYENYAGYDYVEYVTADNSGLSFVINTRTGKVALIRYQGNRHGNTTVLEDIKQYGLLPYLK